jgi:hypothetical protein
MAFATDAIIGFTEPVKTIELAASETGTLSKLNIKRGDFAGTNQVIWNRQTGLTSQAQGGSYST